jgi:hypothetical protein
VGDGYERNGQHKGVLPLRDPEAAEEPERQ